MPDNKAETEQIDIIKNEQGIKKYHIKLKFNSNILFLFLTRIIYGYLPLLIYLIVKGLEDLQGAFLALSYVFLSQVATTKLDKDPLNNLLFAGRIALAMISLSISFLYNNHLLKSWLVFFIICAISLFTLYFDVIKYNQPKTN